jgi:hypothetical protein
LSRKHIGRVVSTSSSSSKDGLHHQWHRSLFGLFSPRHLLLLSTLALERFQPARSQSRKGLRDLKVGEATPTWFALSLFWVGSFRGSPSFPCPLLSIHSGPHHLRSFYNHHLDQDLCPSIFSPFIQHSLPTLRASDSLPHSFGTAN